MKILAPISHPSETEDLIKKGADNLYCGLLTPQWKEKYTNAISANRRSYSHANLSNFDQLRRILEYTSGTNAKILLTLNAFYSKQQYPLLFSYIEKAMSLGVKGFIIGDISFLKTVRTEFAELPIYVSVLHTVFNSQIVNLLKSLKVARITLPQYMSLEEIKKIISENPSMNFEVFVRNAGCRYVQGFCEFGHGLEEYMHKKPEIVYKASPCFWNNYTVTSTKTKTKIPEKIESFFSRLPFPYIEVCAACNLWDFKNYGIQTVKIAGREFSKDIKLRDTQFIKNLILYLESEKPHREDFRNYAKNLFTKTYGFGCKESLCYYAC